MNMSIIDRYIFREIVSTSAVVMLVLLVIVMSTEMVYVLKHMAEGTIPADGLLSFMANSAMGYVITLLPLCIFMGVLLAFGRLYKDSEMTAILTSGVGLMRCNRPVLLVVVPLSIMLLFLMLYVAPWVEQQRIELRLEFSKSTEGNQFAAGEFNQPGSGKTVFFMGSDKEDGGSMRSVFYSSIRDGEETLDIAQRATSYEREDGSYFTVMHDGRQYTGNAGEANYRIIEYEEYGVLIPEKSATLKYVPNKARQTSELWVQSEPAMLAELQWRFTIPIAAVIAGLIAFPLSYASPRSGRFSKIAVAILVYLVYSNLLGVGKSWIARETIPVWVGTWWVHVLAILLLVALWKRGGFLDRQKVNLK